eukprot:3508326-Amphidinium_carterae.1
MHCTTILDVCCGMRFRLPMAKLQSMTHQTKEQMKTTIREGCERIKSTWTEPRSTHTNAIKRTATIL